MGIAALWIFIYHVFANIQFTDKPLLFELQYCIIKLGDCGVNIFFFLSGIGLPNSLDNNPSIRDFYRKRIGRLLLSGIVSLMLTYRYYSWNVKDLILNGTGYNFLFKSVTSYYWFFYAIIVIYILFPMYYTMFKKSRNKTLFTAVCSSALFLLMIVGSNSFINKETYVFIARIPCFFIGVLFNYLGKNENFKYSFINVSIHVVMLIVGVLSGYLILVNDIDILFPRFHMFFSYSLIALGACFVLPLIFNLIKKTPILSFFGTISLEFYTFQRFDFVIRSRINTPFVELLIFLICTASAYILYLINTSVLKLTRKNHPVQ